DVPDADGHRRSAGERHRPRRREEELVRRHGLRRPYRQQRRQGRLESNAGSPALRDHAPRDRAVGPCADVRRNGQEGLPEPDLRSNALAGHVEVTSRWAVTAAPRSCKCSLRAGRDRWKIYPALLFSDQIMSACLKYPIAACIFLVLVGTPSSINATPQGFLEGQLKIISRKPVELADENTAPMTVRN